ncbi:MAG: DUF4258 domain-containing protein [Candidatus Abyssobacteria bacterium SURF_5]|uniref:DUF4258 domain-containing protein n=1 Tax=Abyssobacteria bacterium (strain SURF_5) TaxID=2093360 RepID=A0A3A4N589_ABYX5|nr:MAG: DUF4258 domain-containing protein [Candidatus Abyssubacteria bacterium SURF_5]
MDTDEQILARLRTQVEKDEVRVTQHAHQEMVEEEISLNDIYEAVASARIVENYPEHRRGACCLIAGYTSNERPLHVVCTTGKPVLIIITAYEPKPPKWRTPFQREQGR